jgi:hypothetical protein
MNTKGEERMKVIKVDVDKLRTIITFVEENKHPEVIPNMFLLDKKITIEVIGKKK